MEQGPSPLTVFMYLYPLDMNRRSEVLVITRIGSLPKRQIMLAHSQKKNIFRILRTVSAYKILPCKK